MNKNKIINSNDCSDIIVCLGEQYFENIIEEAKINSIGFVQGGRELLNNQEHIFVEALADMEVPDDETKFKNYMTKYFKQAPSAERSMYV